MLCAQCNQEEAIFHFNGMMQDKILKLDLCENCAKSSGLPIPAIEAGLGGLLSSPMNLSNTSTAFSELISLLSDWAKAPIKTATQKGCPRCHWTILDFQKTGNMGCPDCYKNYRTEVHGIVKKIQVGSMHKGKKIPKHSEANSGTSKPRLKEKGDSLMELRLKLEKAVKEERFEEAAEFRDKIKTFEKETS